MKTELKGKLVQDYALDKCIPYERNNKNHSDQDVDRLAITIKLNGFTDPILVNKKGVIIAGHGRVLAMKKLGAKTIPAFVVDHLSEDQERALRISHNKAGSTDYNFDNITLEFKELNGSVDHGSFGFIEKELAMLTADIDDSIGDFDESVFVDDIGDAVEKQNIETAENIGKADAKMVPLTKTLGFKEIPKGAEKDVITLMSQMEYETGKKGAEAFCEWVSALVRASE